jgi:hypothetical protein
MAKNAILDVNITSNNIYLNLNITKCSEQAESCPRHIPGTIDERVPNGSRDGVYMNR